MFDDSSGVVPAVAPSDNPAQLLLWSPAVSSQEKKQP